MAVEMSVEEMQSRIVQLEVDQSITKTELMDVLREMESQKRWITNIVEREFAMVKARIDMLLNDTQREINNLSAANKDLLDKTARAVDILETRLRMVENKAGAVDMLETRLRVVENRADPGVGEITGERPEIPKPEDTSRSNQRFRSH